MPTMHNPLGAVMNQPDRARLVGIARRHGQLLIEDASYAYLAEDPPPPLAALAPDITVYVSGLSKSVATGLRVGYQPHRRHPYPQPHLRLNRRTIHHDHPHSAGHPARTRLGRPRHPARDVAHSC